MKVLLPIALLFMSLLSFTSALPTENNTAIDINVNGTVDTIVRAAAGPWCNFNIGLVEYFPRGGTTGGRHAAVRIGPVHDSAGKRVTGFTWDNGAAPTTERRIDNWTIRVYDLFKYGDSLAFSWYHPDNNNPNYEWLDFNFNGAKWNDRDSNCGRPGSNHNCCEIGPWYSDGPNRMKRGINCGFACG
jgi:hypothetical protein